MGKRLNILVILFVLTLFVFTSSAEESAPASIEQVYVNLPEITVYGNDLTIENADQQEAYLGGNKVHLSQYQKFSESGEGIYYYLLLDVSNSMPDEHFRSIKEAILQFEGSLGLNDRLILYTFGEEVKLVLDADHDRAVSSLALSGIQNVDQRTLLFEAVSQAADDSQTISADICKRKIIMVFSDGEDFATGKTMSSEALENLKVKGVPAYAFGIDTAAREYLNSFGEFSRLSGGQFYIFNEGQASDMLGEFHESVINSDVLCFTTESNIVSNKMETFSLHMLAPYQILIKEVMVSRWVKDTQAPRITKTEKISDRQIELEFSEAVTGSGQASNYSIKKGDKIITISGVSAGEGRNIVTLTVGQELEPGDYAVACPEIRDISMEENSVSETGSFTVEQLPLNKRVISALKDWFWIPVILAVMALAAFIYIFFRKIKNANGVIYVDGKPVMASNVEIHEHVSIQEKEGKDFQMVVSVNGNYPETRFLSLTDSFIVGRSQINNLYFDDSKMSRQHFALEWDV